ncbi:hypothetical protein DL96DRAFT_1694624 [Flagelloscypha sp. PMI_526]|nr:hypothetical protein DL96DRAFT_1694624 [Flagelloscypha sp. PMI_526]
MPSIFSAVKKISRRTPKDPTKKSHSTQLRQDVKLDFWITTARLLKAAGENLPFPWLKGAADLAIQVIEPLRLARSNQQDFSALAQDIIDTLRPIQDQAAALNSAGSSKTALLEEKCKKFTEILKEMLKDFEAVRTDILQRKSAASWTTPAMQRLIQSYQDRLRKEVRMFNTSNIMDIHISVHRTEDTTAQIQQTTEIISTKLNAILPPPTQSQQPELENYRSLKVGDLRVMQTRNMGQLSESHVFYKGEKTWRIFREGNAEQSWIEEVKFYHTTRFHPHIRQLFGFTQSQDFLGLVFHEHSMPIYEVWSEMPPIERVLSVSQFYLQWNKALGSLLSQPSSQELICQNTWLALGNEAYINSNTALSSWADRSGGLHVVFSSVNKLPALRYKPNLKFSSFLYNMGTIRHLRKIFLSSRDNISQTDALDFYKIIDITARESVQDILCRRISLGSYIETSASLSVQSSFSNSWASHHAYIHNIAPPFQTIRVHWRSFSFVALDRATDTSWYRESLQLNRTTNFFFSGDSIPAQTWTILAFQHIPAALDTLRELFRPNFRNNEFTWVYEYPDKIELNIHIEVLGSKPPTLLLHIFLCPQLFAFKTKQYDASDLFYLSFDPLGQVRLKEHDLHRLGLVVTSGFFTRSKRKTLASFAVEAISEVVKSCDSPFPDSLQPVRDWPITRVARYSSVDRFVEYPRPFHVQYDHIHAKSAPLHEALCSLVCQMDGCICREVRIQQFGVDLDVPYIPNYALSSPCPCHNEDSPASRKRRKAKSLDRADRIDKAISKWIYLLKATGMNSRDLHGWYVDPSCEFRSKYPRYELPPPGPRRSGISPWTTLIQPMTSERGRSTRVTKLMNI